MPNIKIDLFNDMFFKVSQDFQTARQQLAQLKLRRKTLHAELKETKQKVKVWRKTFTGTGDEASKNIFYVHLRNYKHLRSENAKVLRDLENVRIRYTREYRLYNEARRFATKYFAK